VRFKVSNLTRRFTVHEDLICRTSTLFRLQLQKNRKPLPPTAAADICCICHDDLDPTTKDIAYCVTCGKNIHELCIKDWKRKSDQQPGDRPPPTCPMCRATWKNEPLLKHLTLDDDLDAQAVQMYLDWLYSTDLRVPSSVSRDSDAFNVALLECWAVAGAVDDHAFKTVVIKTYFTEAGVQFWDESINWAFEDGYGNEEICRFVIDVFMTYMEPGWFRDESKGWPDGFVREVAERAWEGCRTRKSYKDVKREWLGRLQEEEEEAEDKVEEVRGGNGNVGAAGAENLTKDLIDEFLHGPSRESKRKTSSR
jgi:hypothetical protein